MGICVREGCGSEMDLIKARALAEELMKQHGIEGWTFEWDRALRRFGQCNYMRKVISLSKKLTLLNDEDHVRDTVLHEIAHVLTGPGKGHSVAWQSVAKSIGCNGQRLYDGQAVVSPPPRYWGTCPACGNTITRYRLKMIACSDCCKTFNRGKFDKRFLFVWEDLEK